jgi:hypothetical protein
MMGLYSEPTIHINTGYLGNIYYDSNSHNSVTYTSGAFTYTKEPTHINIVAMDGSKYALLPYQLNALLTETQKATITIPADQNISELFQAKGFKYVTTNYRPENNKDYIAKKTSIVLEYTRPDYVISPGSIASFALLSMVFLYRLAN